MTLIFIAIAALVFTVLGGFCALRFRDTLHLVLGFSAGAVLGVAFFDLLPEAVELAEGVYDISSVAAAIIAGFVAYMILDRFAGGHRHTDDHCENEHHRNDAGGSIAAGSLSLHGFLDGVAIGVAFQVSAEVGLAVTFAVLAHKFFDGLNTVSLVLKHGGTQKQAFRWLSVGAVAPVVGIISASLVSFEASSLGVILALFCGFFLYIGASDLLPESHHRHPTHWTTLATVVGILAMYVVISVSGI